jgi:hypothetical protein
LSELHVLHRTALSDALMRQVPPPCSAVPQLLGHTSGMGAGFGGRAPFSLGETVGAAVGTADGELVGVAVGKDDGIAVGAALGAAALIVSTVARTPHAAAIIVVFIVILETDVP